MGAALRVDLGAEKGSVTIVCESSHGSGNYIEDPCGVVSYITLTVWKQREEGGISTVLTPQSPVLLSAPNIQAVGNTFL